MFRKYFKRLGVDNMKRTGFAGYVYDSSVSYDDIRVDDIKDIHKYLMEKMILYDYVYQSKN